MVSSRTRLETANSILTTCGERPLTASGGTVGAVVNDCIREAIHDVCTGNTWNELRQFVLGTWSGDRATLDDNVYRIQAVTWYSSPDGSPEATYDYARYNIEFVTLDHFESLPSTPYTNGRQNLPRYWTIESSNVVRVNPYPNDSTERNKIRFIVYKEIDFPSTDSNFFSCSDRLLNLIQWKGASLFALKFLSDGDLFNMTTATYEQFRKKLLVSDTALPSGGYTIFRGRR